MGNPNPEATTIWGWLKPHPEQMVLVWIVYDWVYHIRFFNWLTNYRRLIDFQWCILENHPRSSWNHPFHVSPAPAIGSCHRYVGASGISHQTLTPNQPTSSTSHHCIPPESGSWTAGYRDSFRPWLLQCRTAGGSLLPLCWGQLQYAMWGSISIQVSTFIQIPYAVHLIYNL